MLNALTVDLEDWYHPELVRHRLPRHPPRSDELQSKCEVQIERSTQLLLDLLRERRIKATFFVVGEVVQRHPRLMEAVISRGHEVACHGMSHRPLWEMTADELRSELHEFAGALSTVAPNVKVVGFRAPTFSLDNRTRWALGVLAEFGFRYDSSIFPVRTPLYGVDGCPLTPYRPSSKDVTIAANAGTLVEFPMSIWTWANLRVPVCGGFYLRALPFGFIRFSLQQINQRRPFAIYIHPWEILPDTPRLKLPFLSRLVTYYNIGSMESRLVGLLDAFSFAPMRTVLEEMGELSK